MGQHQVILDPETDQGEDYRRELEKLCAIYEPRLDQTAAQAYFVLIGKSAKLSAEVDDLIALERVLLRLKKQLREKMRDHAQALHEAVTKGGTNAQP